jgi:hypothetical protein
VETSSPEAVEHAPREKRRSWRPLIAVVAAVVLGALAFGLGVTVGSDGADDEVDSVEAPDVVNRWGEAFVAGDPGELAALYSEGATFNCRAFDFTIGKEKIADVVMGDESAFSEVKPTTVLVGDEIVAVEYMVRRQSPSGEDISTPLIAVFDIDDDGLIVGSTIDYDRREMFPEDFNGASEQGLSPFGCDEA